MNIHGGYWRAKYDLQHAGHLCAALTAKGLATWNVEYRRVGNPGGGWPGTFEDLRSAYRYVSQLAQRYNLDLSKMVVSGHSAGGQLALCLAGHETTIKRVVSLAGVVDLQQAWELHLSDNAVVDFLGGEPSRVPEHYREADPMQLKISVGNAMADSRRLRRHRAAISKPQLHRAEEKAGRERALSGNIHRGTLRPDRSPLQRVAQGGRHGAASSGIVAVVARSWSRPTDQRLND